VLVALNASKHRVVAEVAARGEQYVCPACGESVVLKKGARVVHHFAHRPQSPCDFAGETMRHLEMKLRMFDGMRSLNPELEVVMCDGARRADVVVLVNGKHIAVECQQSSIDIDELKQRNSDYHGQVLWILDAPRFFGTEGVRTGKIRPRRKTPLALRYLIAIYDGLYVLDGDRLFFDRISRVDDFDCNFFGCRTISNLWADSVAEIKQPWSIGFRSNRVPVPVTTPVPDEGGWL